MKMTKVRLDKLLVDRGLAESRERARSLILGGFVLVKGRVEDKAGSGFDESAPIEVRGKDCPYVSRGGLKLAGALDAFGIDPKGMRCLDVGLSTGGFTDCLLSRGAARVVGVDVGYGQLAWKLRQDPRVAVHERTNARTLSPEIVGEQADLAVIDVSFISLTLVLPAVTDCVRAGGRILALVKPQFEVGKGKVGSGGVVRDEGLQLGCVEKVRSFGREKLGLSDSGFVESAVRGPKGNREYFVNFLKEGR